MDNLPEALDGLKKNFFGLDVMKSKYLKFSKIQKFLELLKKKVKMWFLLT